MRNTYIESAFSTICKTAKTVETWYISLIEEIPYYIGPEEGGSWGRDHILIAYQECRSEEEAEQLRIKIKELAKELSTQSQTEYGEYCLRSMEWLEERGLDADFLSEPDGPSEYYVVISQGLLENSYGARHYS